MNNSLATIIEIHRAEAPVVESGKSRLYWPQLDGLRFIAASLVFLAHAPALPFALFKVAGEFGWCGVDLFLVLSAFLLTRLLRAEWKRTGEIDAKSFYLRRILRIWPLHWGFITAMLGVQYLWDASAFQESIGFWLSNILFANNLIVSTIGFERRLAFTSHLWTISLEEQFYVFLPMLLAVLFRRNPPVRLLGTGVITLLALLWGIRLACVLLNVPHPFIWVLPLRADAFILGVALGLGVFDGLVRKFRAVWSIVLGIIAFSLAACMPSHESPGWSQVFIYTVVDIGCVLLVAGTLEKSCLSAFLSNAAFRYLGKVSFGIYVYHLIALAIGKRLSAIWLPGNPWLIFAVSFTVTIAMASMSYQIFERRFIVLKVKFTSVMSRPA